jgi:hypothetical protein
MDSYADRGAFATFATDFRGSRLKNIAAEDFCDLITEFVEQAWVPFATFATNRSLHYRENLYGMHRVSRARSDSL